MPKTGESSQGPRPPRVLIIENDPVAAGLLQAKMKRRNCDCVSLVLPHATDFELALSEMFTNVKNTSEVSSFDGTLLDVMFGSPTDGKGKETDGGAELYEYLAKTSDPCLLDHLGIVLVVSQHIDSVGAFKKKGFNPNPKLRFTVNYPQDLLGRQLDEFSADMMKSI